jgi:probable FeS assembly SUF system protein SufT
VEPGALARVFVGNSNQLGSEELQSGTTKHPAEGGRLHVGIEVFMTNERINLSRACEVIGIPSGIHEVLQAGTQVRIMQSLGGSYTVWTERGGMYRVDTRDADALGLTPHQPETGAQPEIQTGAFNEQMVWDQLKTVYDPEIPVNIVDLGLVYSCAISDAESGKKIEVKMTMTAPGCGMGNVIKADVERKLSSVPEVKQVDVEVVFDPPWHPGLMSEAAKLQLGFDLDYGSGYSPMPVMR